MPLSGVKVIEVGLNLAGPIVGEIMAGLGADVIKVERPITGLPTNLRQLRAVLSHRAGLPVVEGDFTLEQALSWDPVVE